MGYSVILLSFHSYCTSTEGTIEEENICLWKHEHFEVNCDLSQASAHCTWARAAREHEMFGAGCTRVKKTGV
jgi:hypothetical protein